MYVGVLVLQTRIKHFNPLPHIACPFGCVIYCQKQEGIMENYSYECRVYEPVDDRSLL